MTKNMILKAALISGLLIGASSADAQSVAITLLDCPAAGSTTPSSINAAGQVTGYCNDSAGNHAFVTNGATVTTFNGGTPNSITNGLSINAGGQVTGYYLDGLGGNLGFVYSSGVVSLFTVLNSNNLPTTIMTPRSINASGQVTGEFIDPTLNIYRGFVYDPATKTATPFDAIGTGVYNSTGPISINDSGQITGTAGDVNGTHGFLKSGGIVTLFDAANAAQTVPRGMNNLGQVVGTYYDINNVQHGFVYSGGTVTALDVAGATVTDAWSINDSGQIAGYYTDAAAVIHGFVKTGTTVTTVNVAGSAETAVRSINATGQGTGYYVDPVSLAVRGFVSSAVSSTPAPIVFSPTLANGTANAAYSSAFATASGGTGVFTYTATGLPAGLTLTGNVVSGTPLAAGVSSVTLKATDTSSKSVSATVTLTISAPVAPLMIATTSLPGATAGVAYTAPVTVSGGVAPYTVTLSGLPKGLTYSGGNVTGTPAAVGTFSVSVTAVDATGATAAKTLSLTVLDQTIGFAPALPAGTVGTPYSATLSASGFGPFVYGATGLPAGLTLSGNTISGTPTAAGSSAVGLTATDAAKTVAAVSVTLTINASSATPSYTIEDESQGKITAIASDYSYLMVGAKKLIWSAATHIQVNTNSVDLHTVTSFVKVGMGVQWKGLRNKATDTVLTSQLEIN